MLRKSSSIERLAKTALLLVAIVPGIARSAEQCPEGARSMLDAAAGRLDGDVEAALRDYELVIQSFADSSCAAEAMFVVAATRFDRVGEPELAIGLAEELVTRHPTSVWAASGHVLLGRIRIQTALGSEDLEQGRELLRRSWVLFPSSRYPDLEARSEGRVLDGEAAYRLGDLDGAAESFLAVVEDEPPSRWLTRAEIGLATVLLEAGRWQAAADLLQDSLDRLSATAHEDGSGPAGLEEWRDRVARRLTIIHRLRLRPSIGSDPWSDSRTLPLAPTGIEKPRLVAARENGSLIVSGNPRDQISILAPDGSVVRASTGVDVQDLSWGADGRPYRCSRNDVAGVEGAYSRQFMDPDKDNRMLDKLDRAVRGDIGRWFVIAARSVYQVQDTGESRIVFDSSSSSQPVDLALDPRGRLYILDGKSNRVLRFDPHSGKTSAVVSAAWRDPVALTVDSLGDIYVLDEDQGLYVFAPDGEGLARIGLSLPGGSTLDKPTDIAVDGTGRVYIVDASQGRVLVLD
jgi:streptogramin lyase